MVVWASEPAAMVDGEAGLRPFTPSTMAVGLPSSFSSSVSLFLAATGVCHGLVHGATFRRPWGVVTVLSNKPRSSGVGDPWVHDDRAALRNSGCCSVALWSCCQGSSPLLSGLVPTSPVLLVACGSLSFRLSDSIQFSKFGRCMVWWLAMAVLLPEILDFPAGRSRIRVGRYRQHHSALVMALVMA